MSKSGMISKVIAMSTALFIGVSFVMAPVKVNAAAYDFEDENGVRYQIKTNPTEEDNGTCIVVGGKKNITTVEIPMSYSSDDEEEEDEYDVVGIKKGAFKGCKKITYVSIDSDSAITSIPNNAFEGCTKLKKVELENETLKTIGKNAFKNCKNLSSISIESTDLSLKNIKTDAFKNTKKGMQVSGYDLAHSKKLKKMIEKRGGNKVKAVDPDKDSDDDDDDDSEDDEE
ncbi:MAG: leucine-rich repeat domain-containing protein [Treponema sp.]|nr:leucine-rich repeat domain-containing protein [Treponema sp.]